MSYRTSAELDVSMHSRWLMLLVLFVARTAMACQFQSVASSAASLVDALEIDFTSLGGLIGLYMLPGIFIALPGGVLGQRFGAKPLFLMGLLLMAAGGAGMGASHSFQGLAVGRLVSGMGGVLVNVMAAKMIADWFANREIVTAMAVLVVSWPLGLALGLLMFAPVAASHSWNVVMYSTAFIALASLLLVATAYRDPATVPTTQRTKLSVSLTKQEWLGVSLAGGIWMTYNVGYIVLVSFVPGLFATRGYTTSEAAWVVSFLGWMLIPAVPLAGSFAERVGRPNEVLLVSLLLSGLAAAFLPFAANPILPFGILAVVIGVPAGLIMAFPAQSLRSNNRASGMGVYFTWYYIGMTVLPGVAGLTRDITASPSAPALLSAAMMTAAVAGVATFRLSMR